MMQVCQIFPGGKQFTLKHNGGSTCAVSYQGGFVMMGDETPTHGKVDRWEKHQYLVPHFSPRYDPQGKYLDPPLPNLLEARYHHACTTFISSNGEEVSLQNLPFLIPTGLVGHRRFKWWKSLKHRVVLAVNEPVDQRRSSSQAFSIKKTYYTLSFQWWSYHHHRS